MAVNINASTSSGLIQSADTSGILQLQSNGTTQFTVASTGAYGQLKSATAQASTSGTSIDFTSIPSWVKRITVMFDNVSTNGSSVLLIQLGDSGGIENTGYVSSATNTGASTLTSATNTSGFGLQSANAAANIACGVATIANVTGNTWSHSCNIGYTSAGLSLSGGAKTLSATLDRVRITTVNGTDTFDAGSINILYEG